MVKKKVNIEFLHFNLGLRKSGEHVRELIEKNLKSDKFVVFDFSNVEIVSNSFADECFGKLFLSNDKDFITSNSTFKNSNPFINRIIKHSINQRLNRSFDVEVTKPNLGENMNSTSPLNVYFKNNKHI